MAARNEKELLNVQSIIEKDGGDCLPVVTDVTKEGDCKNLIDQAVSKYGGIDVLINNYMFDLISFKDMDKVLTEFKRVLRNEGKLILVNMTEGERFGSKLYDFVYKISPKTMGGCRGVKLSDRLADHGFIVEVREYYQQMLFPSEVILAYK